MSIPGDQSSYDYNIFSNLSDNLNSIYLSTHPKFRALTIETFVLAQLASAKHAGMLPSQLIEEIEESIEHLKARSICDLTLEELETVQKALKKRPSDSDSGLESSRSVSPMIDHAQKTTSWVATFFPAHGLFLPAFSSTEALKPSQGLSKQEAALLIKVLQESGYSTIRSYMQALAAAKQACPSDYTFNEDQLAVMNEALTSLSSSLQRTDSGYPLQFDKDNITGLRMPWVTLSINGTDYRLNSQESIAHYIEQVTQVATSLSPDHAHLLRDSFLLIASQTLVNPLQQGKNDLAFSIMQQTDLDLEGSILPSRFSIENMQTSSTGCSFTCDVSYNYSYKLKLSASDKDKESLNPLLKKQGLDEIFSGKIQARFEAQVDYGTNSFSLHLSTLPVVTVKK